MDAEALPGRRRLPEESAEERRADAPAALLGDERDVDDPDLLLGAGDVQATDRPPRDEDYVEARALVVLPVGGLLGVELHADERLLLLGAPGEERELVGSGARVDLEQEGLVVGPDRP